MLEKRSRKQMAQCVARDIPAGSYVNLGIGLPVLVLDFWKPEDEVIVHSENGILGMRALAGDEQADPDVTNAAKLPVGMVDGGAYFHHADSFAMMRGGHLDFCVLGAFQVSEKGDLANWHTGAPGAIPAVGGAMDLAIGAKQVFVMMEHQTKQGESKVVPECTYPLTGIGCVTRIYTDLATIDVTPDGLVARDLVDGLSFDELQRLTGVPLKQAVAA